MYLNNNSWYIILYLLFSISFKFFKHKLEQFTYAMICIDKYLYESMYNMKKLKYHNSLIIIIYFCDVKM